MFWIFPTFGELGLCVSCFIGGVYDVYTTVWELGLSKMTRFKVYYSMLYIVGWIGENRGKSSLSQDE